MHSATCPKAGSTSLEDDLESGALVRVMPEYELEAFPLHTLHPASSYVPAKTKLFIEPFQDAMRASKAFEAS